MDTKGRKKLPGLGVEQPNVKYGNLAEPETVTDPGDGVKWKTTVGKSGSTKRDDGNGTSQSIHSTPTGE